MPRVFIVKRLNFSVYLKLEKHKTVGHVFSNRKSKMKAEVEMGHTGKSLAECSHCTLWYSRQKEILNDLKAIISS